MVKDGCCIGLALLVIGNAAYCEAGMGFLWLLHSRVRQSAHRFSRGVGIVVNEIVVFIGAHTEGYFYLVEEGHVVVI